MADTNGNEALKKLAKVIDAMSEDRKAERTAQEKERRQLITEVGKNLAEVLAPALQKMAEMSRDIKDDLREALAGLRVEIPPIEFPEINVPAPQVTVRAPEVNVPPIRIPDIEVPAAVVNFPDELEVKIKGVGPKSPLPVILTDRKGDPYEALFNMVTGGGAGNAPGGAQAFKNVTSLIRGIEGSAATSLINPDGQLRVAVNATGAGTQFAEDAAHTSGDSGTAALVVRQDTAAQLAGTDGDYSLLVNDASGRLHVNPSRLAYDSGVTNGDTVRVVHVTDVATSVNVTGFTSSVAVSIQTDDGDSAMDEANDAVRVNVVAGSLSANTEYNDDASPDQAGGTGILQMIFDGGSVQSRNGTSFGVAASAVSGFDGSLAAVTSGALDSNLKYLNGTAIAANSGVANDQTLRIVQATDSISSVSVTNSITIGTFPDNEPFNVAQINGLTTGFGSGVDNTGVLRVSHAVDIATSTNVIQLGGNTINTGAGTVGTGTLRTVIGSDSTVMVVGDIASDVADDASNPVKFGGTARTANPTNVAAGDRVTAGFDVAGRQIIMPIQVRGLLTTAYATLNTNTETTLRAGVASTFNDLVYIMGSNTSAGAVSVDVRDATGGGVIMTLNFPAEGTAGVAPAVPIPQNLVATAWTVDFNDSDISNTTVYFSGLFAQNL